MKNKFLVLLLLSAIHASAQQSILYQNQFTNNYNLNPAITGIEDFTDVRLSYRDQWSGIPGNPKITTITAHMPLGTKHANNISFGDYKAADAHHGIGIKLEKQSFGPFVTNNANLSYAYHLKVGEKANLALGVSAGISKLFLDYAKISTHDPNDQAISSTYINRLSPNVGMGIWYYHQNFYFGTSVLNLIENKVGFTADPATFQSAEARTIIHNMGLRVPISENWALSPAIMLGYSARSPLFYTAYLKTSYKNIFWLGLARKNNQSMAGLFGLNVSSKLTISYSYDAETGPFRTNNLSHELSLGLMLNNKKDVRCPQKFW